MYRIWIDMDSVIYDLSSPWYAQHNRDFPNHVLTVEDVTEWDTAQACRRANCDANIYSYFNNAETWSEGAILGGSHLITKLWQHDYPDINLGILTTAANGMSMPLKIEWLREHFPHIKDHIIVNGHLKHLIYGEILIDDATHNVQDFKGIGILYAQPWNKSAHDNFIVANGRNDVEKWLEVDRLVRRAIQLLDDGYKIDTVKEIMRAQNMIGL